MSSERRNAVIFAEQKPLKSLGFNDLIPCQTVTVGHITLGHTFPGVARISLGAKH